MQDLVDKHLSLKEPAFFLVRRESDSVVVGTLQQWEEFKGKESIYFAFVDPCNLAGNPGWPLRNYLMLLAARWNLQGPVQVIALKQPVTDSLVFTVELSQGTAQWHVKFDDTSGQAGLSCSIWMGKE